MKSPKPAIADMPAPRLRRFLRLAEVRRITGMSTSTIYFKISAGEFPRQIKLFSNPRAKKQSVVWLEDEIVAWQQSRIADRDQAPPPKPYRMKKRRAEHAPTAVIEAAE
jgi:prophage regulatory protein